MRKRQRSYKPDDRLFSMSSKSSPIVSATRQGCKHGGSAHVERSILISSASPAAEEQQVPSSHHMHGCQSLASGAFFLLLCLPFIRLQQLSMSKHGPPSV